MRKSSLRSSATAVMLCGPGCRGWRPALDRVCSGGSFLAVTSLTNRSGAVRLSSGVYIYARSLGVPHRQRAEDAPVAQRYAGGIGVAHAREEARDLAAGYR